VTTLRELAGQAASCTRCDLYQRATATVLGEGRARAAMAFVGEQPGDQEDKQGHPFVGPAGHVLDRALNDAGISRPRLVVLLGAVAGEAVFGSRFRVGEHQGKVEDATLGSWQGLVLSTIHPSAVLRTDDAGARERSYAGLVADLVTAREAAGRGEA